MMAAHKHLFQDAVTIAQPEHVIASTLLPPKHPQAPCRCFTSNRTLEAKPPNANSSRYPQAKSKNDTPTSLTASLGAIEPSQRLQMTPVG